MSATLGQIAVIPGADNLVQYLICKITGSHVAHTIVDIGNGECIGAEPGGARIRPLTDYPTAIWSKFDLTPAQAQASADWARAKEHTPYNYVDDAIIGFECAFHMTSPRFIRDRFQDEDTLECAQLCDGALTQGAGISVFPDGRAPGEVFPGSFEFLFIQRGWYGKDQFAGYRIAAGSLVQR